MRSETGRLRTLQDSSDLRDGSYCAGYAQINGRLLQDQVIGKKRSHSLGSAWLNMVMVHREQEAGSGRRW